MPRYQDAIEWLAYNDDTDSVTEMRVESDAIPTVTIAMVADLWGKRWIDVANAVRKQLGLEPLIVDPRWRAKQGWE
jgi:hypothetical protein